MADSAATAVIQVNYPYSAALIDVITVSANQRRGAQNAAYWLADKRKRRQEGVNEESKKREERPD